MTDEEEQIFLAARSATSRSAYTQHLRREGVDENSDELALKTAIEKFRNLPLLHDSKLLDSSLHALSEARGRTLNGTEPFPSMLWLGGATDTYDGRAFNGNIVQFVKLLNDRARVHAPKRSGWVIEPVSNIDGHRTNASTKKMHALFLDCDGSGTWDDLLGVLNRFDFCFVAYQSGGWSPTIPKWRVVLPLHAPHDTSTEMGQLAWKVIYNHARVVFGAIARLLSVGFDPATETPCCPWFLTEKRDPVDAERKVIYRSGHALDLTAFMLALPEVTIDERTKLANTIANTRLVLDDDHLNKIVDALAQATNRVPSGRRDLYLALPGALLDRGISSDDVLAIIEAVSASYPRPHADKHADNVHNARTTIAKYEAGENYTRIGVLNTIAPAVAQALDRVLPDPLQQAMVQSFEQLVVKPAPLSHTVPGSPTVEASSPSSPSSPVPSVAKKRRRCMTRLGKEMRPISDRLLLSAQPMRRLSGLLLDHMLDGVRLPAAESVTDAQVDELVALMMQTIGRTACSQTRWQEALDLASLTLSLMGVSQSKERVATAERSFYEGQGKRNRAISKKSFIASEYRNDINTFIKNEKV